jgi:hypothetical protein
MASAWKDEMSILRHHTTRREAAEIARRLRSTHRITREICYGYVMNLAEDMDTLIEKALRLGPLD